MAADGVRSHSNNCEIQHVLANIDIAHFKKQHVKCLALVVKSVIFTITICLSQECKEDVISPEGCQTVVTT